MLYFYSSKIILHCFHVDNSKGDSVIGYDKIIGCGLRVKLVLRVHFKRRVIQLEDAAPPKKYPISFLGQNI